MSGDVHPSLIFLTTFSWMGGICFAESNISLGGVA
jgi:hypothetical protein